MILTLQRILYTDAFVFSFSLHILAIFNPVSSPVFFSSQEAIACPFDDLCQVQTARKDPLPQTEDAAKEEENGKSQIEEEKTEGVEIPSDVGHRSGADETKKAVFWLMMASYSCSALF